MYVFKIDKRQGPTRLCSMLLSSLDGRGVWGRMDTYVCMIESLCCSPEAITTLFVNRYAPVQNKNFF